MKRAIVILIVVITVIFFTGCDNYQKIKALEEENQRLKNDVLSKKEMLTNIMTVLSDASLESEIDKSEYKSRVYKDLGVGVTDILINYFYLVSNRDFKNHDIVLQHCTPTVDTFTDNIFYYYLYGSESSETCIFLAINQNKYTHNASRIGLTLKNPTKDEMLDDMFNEISIAFTTAYIMAESSPFLYTNDVMSEVTNFLDTYKYLDGRAIITNNVDGCFHNYMISGKFEYVS